MGVNAAAGEQATWGDVGHGSRVVVEEDPPKWLVGLEEGARAEDASDLGVAPCAKGSSDRSRSSFGQYAYFGLNNQSHSSKLLKTSLANRRVAMQNTTTLKILICLNSLCLKI
jgi:hypothetical protein